MAGRSPLVVIVSGAPGSGKSTLALALSAELQLPHLNKDSLVHGVWRTQRRAFELGVEGVELLYATMEFWLCRGISFVVDQTFVRGVSEPDVGSRIKPHCELVNVHCYSPDATERWKRRMLSGQLCGEQRLAKLRPMVERLQHELSDPLDFGCPTIVVSTADGYRPSLTEIAAAINENHGYPTVHDLDKPAAPSQRETGPGSDAETS